MKKLFILFFIILTIYPKFVFASTTRLNSSAGIGVGSILLDEATFLNPASSAFFKIGALYYQKSKSEFTDTSSEENRDSSTFIASDAKGKMAGSISYSSIEGENDNKKISLSLASMIGERSASGVTYHYENHEQKYKYITIGISHALNEGLTMGFVLNDPLREKEDNSNFMIGLQYTYKDFIALMGDFGTDWKNRFDEKLIYGSAIQFKVLDDLYIRGGIKKDSQKNLDTKGFGGSWTSPRFVLNASMNYILNKNTAKEEKETSFSLSYKF